MSLWKIAFKGLKQRGLASLLTMFSMALGTALVVAVLLIQGVVRDSFLSNSGLGYDMIAGKKGGALQLTVNSVFYLSKPIENLPYDFYLKYKKAEDRADGVAGEYSSLVDFAIPICLGDYVGKYRAVGTTPEMFELLRYGSDEKPFEFREGRNFEEWNEENGYFEAVVGSHVANDLDIKMGDTVSPVHGAVDGAVHEEKFVIVGILETSGTPNDRAVFVNMEGFFLMGGHAKEPDPSSEEEEEPEEEEVAEVQVGGDGTSQRPPGLKDELREVTAILLRSAHPLFARGMFNTVNEGDEAQIVHPVGEIRNLFTFIVEPVQYLLLGLTVLICVVSGISILVSIYNSMSARKKEIAIMRAMGASRRSVTLVVLFESILLSVGGGLFGWFAAHLAIFFAGPIVEDKVGVVVKPWDFAPAMQAADFPTEGIMSWFGAILEFRINEVAIFSNISPEVLVIPGLILLAILVGILPAFAAYRTDVAESL